MSVVLVDGSYGQLTVHRSSGHIIDYDPEGNEPEYSDIVWFDPKRLISSHMDILETAFVDQEGRYSRELSWWEVQHDCDPKGMHSHEFVEPAGYLTYQPA